MALENFETALAFTLLSEGGFSDDPHDPGGATMLGITFDEFRDYFNLPNATIDDLKAITDDQVSQIYHDKYWVGVRGDELPGGVDLSIFDMGVNAGPAASIKIAQREIGVIADGILGPLTLAAINRQVPSVLLEWLETGQERFYRRLSTFQYFGKGWINRTVARFHKASLLTVEVLPSAKAIK